MDLQQRAQATPFVVLREAVLTSDRKADTAGARRIAPLVRGVLMRGLAGLRDRRYCGFWYDRGLTPVVTPVVSVASYSTSRPFMGYAGSL